MFRFSNRSLFSLKRCLNQLVIRGEQTNALEKAVSESLLDGSVKSWNVKEAIQNGPTENQIIVSGWIKTKYRMKDILFVQVTDRSSLKTLQANIPRELVEEIGTVHTGSAVQLLGQIIPSERNGIELVCNSYRVIGGCKKENLPFSISPKNQIPFGVARQYPHLRSLVNPFPSIMRIRSSVISAIHSYYQEAGYTFVTTPLITSNDCEGGGDVFQIKSASCTEQETFFNRDAFLSVSSQLHLEAMANGLGNVFTIAPAFRAENQKSQRHLSEFTMLEAEENFVYTIDELMDHVEYLTRFVGNHVLEKCSEDHQTVLRYSTIKKYLDYEKIIHPKKYLRLTYDDCIELLNKNPKNLEPVKWGQDLQRVHEKILLDYFENYPIFISHFPSNLKPFYMKRDGDKALCMDLIMNIGGEICGGSLRENDPETLKKNLENIGRQKELGWYVELREFGSVPHGGYGIGLDRLIQSIAGIENIREVVPFPRWAHHLSM